MFYSDHLRRFDIVGNAEGHQKPEESASILYIGYSFDQPDIPQTKIRELCRPFGEIKALGHISQAKDNAYKVSISAFLITRGFQSLQVGREATFMGGGGREREKPVHLLGAIVALTLSNRFLFAATVHAHYPRARNTFWCNLRNSKRRKEPTK